jgi:predicted acetyltransferase
LPGLEVRAPRLEDEEQVYAAEAELDGFNFVRQAGESWPDCLSRLERERAGQNLAVGRVPATMLFGLVGTEVVGRVGVRHELTPALEQVGGHIGYAVRPAHRRRGYATRLLAVGLDLLRERGVSCALVTCDEDNVASAATIKRNGGVLENVVIGTDGPKCRYWIDLMSR